MDDILEMLSARAPDLAEQMLDQYKATIPSYASMPDETLRQVRTINERNLQAFVEVARDGGKASAGHLEWVRTSASQRAREGVALSALLSAYRAGAKLAWHEVVAFVEDADPGRLAAALEIAGSLMRWLDDVSTAVSQSYLEEFERISSDREAARRDFIDGAIAGGLSAEEIRARATALGLDPDAPAAIALLSFDHDDADGSRARMDLHLVRSRLRDLPIAGRWVEAVRGTQLVLLFQDDGDGAEAVAAELRTVLGELPHDVPVRAGVGRARDALTDIAGSYRDATLALAASRGASESNVALYGEVLLEELILRERGVSRRLARSILEPLDDLPDLKTTLVEYISHGPSLPAVAKRLFLHPNTVAYRLTRIKELTGRDPKTPAGISELFLALRASQLVGD